MDIISKKILAAIKQFGWDSRVWARQLIVTKDGHELVIASDSQGYVARWAAPSQYSNGMVDRGIVESVKDIVSILRDPNAEVRA